MKMRDDYENYFNQGMIFKQLGDYTKSSDCFKKAANLNKSSAEAWREAGVTLLKLNRKAEAGMFLMRAMTEYDKKMQNDLHYELILFQKACIFSLLGDMENAFLQWEQAVKLDPLLAEASLKEEYLENLRKKPEFQQLLQAKLQHLEQLRYRGKKLRINELNEEQSYLRKKFLNFLEEKGWQINNYAAELESLFGASPQAGAEYHQNEHLRIQLEYYLDENLVLMELTSRINEEERQSYRLYVKSEILPLLEILHSYRSKVNDENWSEMIEALIEVCESVILEMPDGRKVKVS